MFKHCSQKNVCIHNVRPSFSTEIQNQKISWPRKQKTLNPHPIYLRKYLIPHNTLDNDVCKKIRYCIVNKLGIFSRKYRRNYNDVLVIFRYNEMICEGKSFVFCWNKGSERLRFTFRILKNSLPFSEYTFQVLC